jgi:hypothetical protein
VARDLGECRESIASIDLRVSSFCVLSGLSMASSRRPRCFGSGGEVKADLVAIVDLADDHLDLAAECEHVLDPVERVLEDQGLRYKPIRTSPMKPGRVTLRDNEQPFCGDAQDSAFARPGSPRIGFRRFRSRT